MNTVQPDIGFIPTPADAIEALIELAQVSAADVLYDLGCGDGRLLVRAAERTGCTGVGIDVDPAQLRAAEAAAEAANVGDRLRFEQANLYEADLRPATVICLYLLPHLNLRLRPQLLALRPGTRIVSHQFDMGDWRPDQVVHLTPSEEDSTLYLWRV
jgi:SAM-dependent methyltransferase